MNFFEPPPHIFFGNIKLNRLNFSEFNKIIQNENFGVNHDYVDPQVLRNDSDHLSKNQELVSEGKQQFFIWHTAGVHDNVYILINVGKNRSNGTKFIRYRRPNSDSSHTYSIDNNTEYFYEIPNEEINPEELQTLLGTHYILDNNNNLISTDEPLVGGKNKKKSKRDLSHHCDGSFLWRWVWVKCPHREGYGLSVPIEGCVCGAHACVSTEGCGLSVSTEGYGGRMPP